MRIIGGKYRGRQINPPAGFSARPTTDYARESLFNILNNKIDFEELEVLDLFAGTGSISLEFASRGALAVYSVEKNPKSVAFIRKTANELNATALRPVHIDVKAFIRTCRISFDLVFADPPYDLHWLGEIPDLVLNSGIVKQGGIFILEHSAEYTFADNPRFSEHRNYGSVNFTFFTA